MYHELLFIFVKKYWGISKTQSPKIPVQPVEYNLNNLLSEATGRTRHRSVVTWIGLNKELVLLEEIYHLE